MRIPDRNMGDLYQIPSTPGLLPGSWVYIDGFDKYGQVMRTIKEDYKGAKDCGPVHNVLPGGRRCTGKLSLYSIRGVRGMEPPNDTLVFSTVTVN